MFRFISVIIRDYNLTSYGCCFFLLPFFGQSLHFQLAALAVKDKKRNRFALVIKGNCYDLQQIPLFLGMETEMGSK